ncbi:hypothetical protein [Psychrobacter sp. I-STPA10]|uniref:hypothetical protein n=1 Tax=Psychrobacter sp. I-STPA10 TaxID=2585769 RepID=UPI001E2DB3C2|nr:hypothetical protein [Psychrobacter sp. I-STPA10]
MQKQNTIHINDIIEYVDQVAKTHGWIEPENIVGYDKEQIKNDNISSMSFIKEYDDSEDFPVDFEIANYYLDYFCDIDNDIYKLVNYGLWVIVHLYGSTPVYIYPAFMRQHLNKVDTTELTSIFDLIFIQIKKAKEYNDNLLVSLLTEFLFELFQYGSEWGVFAENPQSKPSVPNCNINVKEAKDMDYLCSKLPDSYVSKLASLEQYDRP